MVERVNSRMKGATEQQQQQQQIDNKKLAAALSLKKDQLESELTRQETMSERVVVRKDLRKCNQKIREMTDWKDDLKKIREDLVVVEIKKSTSQLS